MRTLTHVHATSETTVAQNSLAAERSDANGTKSLHSPCINLPTTNTVLSASPARIVFLFTRPLFAQSAYRLGIVGNSVCAASRFAGKRTASTRSATTVERSNRWLTPLTHSK